MEQQIRVAQLLEGRVEGGHQVGGQVADEAHRVGDDDFALARETQTARDRVEGREHLVFDVDVALGQGPQERALAGIRVADDREHRHRAPAAFAPPSLALLGEPRGLAFEACDAVAHAAAIALELRFARAAAADSAGEPRERQVGALGEARHAVAQLGELDLELPVSRRGALREDVEDQLRPVDHAQLHPLGEIARLGGGHVLVEDHEVDVALEAADHQIGELAGADHRARIDGGARLGDHVDDGDPGGPGELAQLGDVHLEGRAVAAGGDRDEDRALAVADVVGRRRAGELVLEVADPAAEFDVEIRRMTGRELGRRAPVGIGRTERRGVGERRQPVVAHPDRYDRIEPQQREVGQIVPGQTFVGQMGLDQAQASQASATRAQATPVRELRVGRAADQDVLDGPRPVEKHPHLPSDLPRQLGQLPGELVRDEAVCVESSPDQALEGLDLAGFEAVGIAVNLDEVLLLPNR